MRLCTFLSAAAVLSLLTPVLQAQSGSAGAGAPAAQSPRLIRFSGSVRRQAEHQEANAAATITFAIYATQEGGEPLWLETQQVNLTATGRYTVLLGSSSDAGIPLDIFSLEEARWLGVRVDPAPEQARILLVSVPYALKAADADRLGGKSAEEYVTRHQLQNLSTAKPAGATVVNASGGATATAVSAGATSFVDSNDTEVVRIEQQGTGYALNVVGKLKLTNGGSTIEFSDGSTMTTAATSVPSGLVALCSFDGLPGFTIRPELGFFTTSTGPVIPEPFLPYAISFSAAGIYHQPDGSDDVFLTAGYGRPSGFSAPTYLSGTLRAHWNAGALALSAPWQTVTTTGVAPVARRDAAYAQVGSKLYVMGGYDGNFLTTNQVLDLATLAWSNAAPVPISVRLAAAAVANGKIYLFGGGTSCAPGSPAGCAVALSNVYEYDPVGNSWTAKAAMPLALWGASAAELDGKIHLLGGAASSYLTVHYVYDPLLNSWSTVAPMPEARWTGLAASVDGRIYVTGGSNANGTLNSAYAWNATADSWVKLSIEEADRGMSFVVGRSTIISIGGVVDSAVKGYMPARVMLYCQKD